jgi:hypothetical protein
MNALSTCVLILALLYAAVFISRVAVSCPAQPFTFAEIVFQGSDPSPKNWTARVLEFCLRKWFITRG